VSLYLHSCGIGINLVLKSISDTSKEEEEIVSSYLHSLGIGINIVL